MSPHADPIPTCKDVMNMVVKECGEPIVQLDPRVFKLEHLQDDMKPLLGDRVFLRKRVAEMLLEAQRRMQTAHPHWQLWITYGYRAPEVQERYFAQSLQDVRMQNPGWNEDEILEEAHRRTAHPLVGGHQTGGAVDVTIWERVTQTELDMGCAVDDTGPASFTNFHELSEEQKGNRLYLHDLLRSVGFSPFLGEWWHFSYGDRDWAVCNKTVVFMTMFLLKK